MGAKLSLGQGLAVNGRFIYFSVDKPAAYRILPDPSWNEKPWFFEKVGVWC
jgi:hypothetical protein